MPTHKDSNHPADIPRDEYLRNELFLLHEEIARMVDRGSWQAVVAARRLALNYRSELDDLAREQATEFDPTDLDEVIAELLKLPNAVFAHPSIRARVAECS